MSVQIDKGITIPGPRGRCTIWPFAELEIGDSFLIEGRKQSAVSGLAGTGGKRLGKKFTTRTVEGDVRIWRVA